MNNLIKYVAFSMLLLSSQSVLATDPFSMATEMMKKAGVVVNETTDDLVFTIGAKKKFFWSRANLNFLATGDASNGGKILENLKCYKCHGDTGIADDDDTPSLAGQVVAYTFKQMIDYKSGVRIDKKMQKAVKKLTASELNDIAAFYALQKPQPMSGGEDIPHLAKNGDKSRKLIGCEDCHNKNAYDRGHQTPYIEGQKPEYMLEMLTMFKDSDRVNDHYRVMRKVAAKLSDEEIEALATYYASKPEEDD